MYILASGEDGPISKISNRVQLVTYVDRLAAGGIGALRRLLDGPLDGLFGGVHLLPFYDPIDGADAGFDPIDHTRVDPRLGTWDDIGGLSQRYALMADVIVNHMSDRSPQFIDYVQGGAKPGDEGLFLTQETVFPGGAREEDLARIYRPRPGRPFRRQTLGNGAEVTLWTTFTAQQVDINVEHPAGAMYLRRIIETLATQGVGMVRLDAVGYAIKRAGTSCFMIPQTFEFISEFTRACHGLGIEVLVEVHSYYQRQIEIAARVDRVYDFALPPLILHAFMSGQAAPLKQWIRVRPANSITVLDTHDGIGIIDIGADPTDREHRPGLVPPADIDRLVEWIHGNSNDESRKATGAAASNLDLYQVNCTFYDALGRDPARYLCARAVQFFLPGIPQVYYVGLFAGGNDMALLARTQVGRDINRHYYQAAEIEAALATPVVRDLVELIRLRNRHPAFGGRFEMLESAAGMLELRWSGAREFALLRADFERGNCRVAYSEEGAIRYLEFSSTTRPTDLTA